MIVLDLECAQEHRFEGWFASQEAFAAQTADHLLTCPICGSEEIRRLPSAPVIARQRQTISADAQQEQLLGQLVKALLQTMGSAENVGERFADEARKIHHGDAEKRNIRGQTSVQEALKLLDEGISVLPLPTAKEDLH